MLTEQRRMHDPICQVVSRSFYPKKRSWLTAELLPDAPQPLTDLPEGAWSPSAPKTGTRSTIARLAARADALVWLDTSGCRREGGYWCNRYEAGWSPRPPQHAPGTGADRQADEKATGAAWRS